jgi:hypothetical protein
MELTSKLGRLTACCVVLMNASSFSFLVILFSSSCIISCLIPLQSLVYTPGLLGYFRLGLFSYFIVLRLYSAIRILSDFPVSPIHFFPHSHGTGLTYAILCFLYRILWFKFTCVCFTELFVIWMLLVLLFFPDSAQVLQRPPHVHYLPRRLPQFPD